MTAKLRLSAQRLLGHQGIGTNGASVNLVINQVGQFEHIDVTDRHRIVKRLAVDPVIERYLPVLRQLSRFEFFFDVSHLGALKDRRGDVLTKLLGGPPEMRLQNLPDIHTRGYPERIENDVHRCAVGQVRHIFYRHNLGDHPLITVPTGHLIADGDFPADGNCYLNQLLDTGRKLRATDNLIHLNIHFLLLEVEQFSRLGDNTVDMFVCGGFRAKAFRRHGGVNVEISKEIGVILVTGANDNRIVKNRTYRLRGLAVQQLPKPPAAQGNDVVDFVLIRLLNFSNLYLLLFLGFLGTLFARKDLVFDYDPFHSRRSLQAGIANITGLLAKNGAQQPFLRRQFRLTLRGNLAD